VNYIVIKKEMKSVKFIFASSFLLSTKIDLASSFTLHPKYACSGPFNPILLSQSKKQSNKSYDFRNWKTETAASTVATGMSDIGDDAQKPPFPVVLWKFTRPHTLIGSFLAIPALHALAAPSYQALFSAQAVASIVFAMVPSLLMNLYITGLNQITDVEIDKINKPNLPIAAGILSKRDAKLTVFTALVLSICMGLSHPVFGSQGLNLALWGSGILGTMYSLPPFRLKRFPSLAAFCIVAVRGFTINAAFFSHARTAAFGDASASVLQCFFSSPKCFLSSIFFGVFGIVIALLKDVPDVKGDEASNVRTLSVQIGQKRVFNAMRRLLTGLFFVYGVGFVRASLNAKTTVLTAMRGLVGMSSLLCGLSVSREAKTVNPEDSKEVYNYYMHLWKLFYLAYMSLPFAR